MDRDGIKGKAQALHGGVKDQMRKEVDDCFKRM